MKSCRKNIPNFLSKNCLVSSKTRRNKRKKSPILPLWIEPSKFFVCRASKLNFWLSPLSRMSNRKCLGFRTVQCFAPSSPAWSEFTAPILWTSYFDLSQGKLLIVIIITFCLSSASLSYKRNCTTFLPESAPFPLSTIVHVIIWIPKSIL